MTPESTDTTNTEAPDSKARRPYEEPCIQWEEELESRTFQLGCAKVGPTNPMCGSVSGS